mmetsp:Transcript_19554/g.40824  ORF Transcript_19554/g.40824 Transcript_19554/m.40824 type:complete len:225 (-) Transcript_19554:973-1647(-)
MASSLTVVPALIAFAHSWIRSAAWIPIMWTPTIFSVSLLKSTLAIPAPSPSASAFEFALNDPWLFPSSHPSSFAFSTACSSVIPTMPISGCVKQAAGTDWWSTAWFRPQMFSTADIPCALAAWASIITPLQSPMAYTLSTIEPPSAEVFTLMFSSTAMKPLLVSTPMVSSPRSFVFGTLPVAIITASSSSVSTCSFVLASIIFTVQGFSPTTPVLTSLANTPVL